MNYAKLLLAIGMLGLGSLGCATARGSADQGQKLLAQDQHAIETSDNKYRDAILKHGESSDEAVKAKTTLDNAKNQYEADRQHVQQLQNMDAKH